MIVILLYAMHAGLKEIESKAIQDYNENFLNLVLTKDKIS
jgi:hypothetical protein